ncbi:MAG: hypothetical protein KGY76_09770, partial [Candidatus Thermoplasmatota archaeon]|nr:hypothetical protein [Candidatus Thermoplasmatota archaeon]
DLKVYIFYSSRTEPEILSVYEGYLTKLEEKNIEYEKIDISESKEKAKEFDIEVTPSICIVIQGEVEMRYEGLAHMKEVLGESMIGDIE